MTVPDLLLAFMAAAVALLGFAGIVALIDRGAARVAPEVASFRVRYLVYAALWTLVLSVAPLLAILSNAPRGVWSAACIAQAFCVVLFLSAILFNAQRMSSRRALGARRAGYYVMFLLALGVLALLAAAVLGVVSASGAYAVGVFWFLWCAAALFARLVFTLDDAIRNAGRRNEAAVANGELKPEPPVAGTEDKIEPAPVQEKAEPHFELEAKAAE